MGGNAFKNTQPITIETLYDIWPCLYNELETLGCKYIQAAGTTFKKPTMGDIDVVVETSYEEFLNKAILHFGKTNVRRINSNIVSISYPMSDFDDNVQVDVIIGNPNSGYSAKFLAWSHFGPSTIKGMQNYSQYKGTVRQLLLNAILYQRTLEYCHKNMETFRQCYQFDISSGLYFVEQTKLGTKNNILKQWKTLSKNLIAHKADDIVSYIFYDQYLKSNDVLTFEDVIRCLYNTNISYRLQDKLDDIIKSFIRDIEIIAVESPLRIAKDARDAQQVVKSLKEYCHNFKGK